MPRWIRSAAILPAIFVGSPDAVAAPDDPATRIDRIFAEWDREDSPGCAVGALERGEFVFRKGYGMADLDHRVPITPDSVFRMASVSKQFTAAATLIAEDQGLLSLEDELAEHFPDLPPWAERVRIRHLLHHTSGIRDYLVVMSLRGQGDADFYTDADVLEALRRLERLNFEPGTEYLYSNSGYWLLARLALRVAGRSLRQFAAEHLLGPVGMDRSHFHDSHREVVPHRARGYRPLEGGGFELDETRLEMVGDGGLYTSVNDLQQWERMFLDPAAFGPDFVERMTSPGRFADGAEQVYASGLALGRHRGLRTVEHGGGFVGFRTHSLRFPDHDFAVFVLCNAASAAPGTLARSVAEVFLADAMQPEAASDRAPPASPGRLAPGRFFSARLGGAAEIRTDDDGALVLTRGGFRSPLRDEGNELTAGVGPDRLRLTPTAEGFALRQTGQREFRYQRVAPWAPGLEALVGLAGTYHCRELEADYEIRVDARPGLTLVLAGGQERPLEPFALLEADADARPSAVFRSEGGTVSFLPDPAAPERARGFTLAAGRARGFVFLRVRGTGP